MRRTKRDRRPPERDPNFVDITDPSLSFAQPKGGLSAQSKHDVEIKTNAAKQCPKGGSRGVAKPRPPPTAVQQQQHAKAMKRTGAEQDAKATKRPRDGADSMQAAKVSPKGSPKFGTCPACSGRKRAHTCSRGAGGTVDPGQSDAGDSFGRVRRREARAEAERVAQEAKTKAGQEAAAEAQREVDQEAEAEVVEVLAVRERKVGNNAWSGLTEEYKVRWAGRGNKKDSWEPACKLVGAAKLLQAFSKATRLSADAVERAQAVKMEAEKITAAAKAESKRAAIAKKTRLAAETVAKAERLAAAAAAAAARAKAEADAAAEAAREAAQRRRRGDAARLAAKKAAAAKAESERVAIAKKTRLAAETVAKAERLAAAAVAATAAAAARAKAEADAAAEAAQRRRRSAAAGKEKAKAEAAAEVVRLAAEAAARAKAEAKAQAEAARVAAEQKTAREVAARAKHEAKVKAEAARVAAEQGAARLAAEVAARAKLCGMDSFADAVPATSAKPGKGTGRTSETCNHTVTSIHHLVRLLSSLISTQPSCCLPQTLLGVEIDEDGLDDDGALTHLAPPSGRAWAVRRPDLAIDI